jgi:hypothetical protein
MNSMKTLLSVSSILALAGLALVASPAAAGSLLVAVGFGAIFVTDYNRARRSLAPRANVVPFRASTSALQVCARAA